MLSDSNLRQFAVDGYVVVPGVVDEHLLAPVDAEIDALVADDPPAAGTTGHHFYFLARERLPAADAALRRSQALAVAETLVAPHGLGYGLDHIQIALNIPPNPHRPGGPHIDGHRPEQSKPDSFTMLAAIYLGDERGDDAGNLWVWPGSHLVHQRLFAERGVGALLAVSGHSTMLDARLPLGEPVQLHAGRGDLLLAHFLLGHNIGPNTSERVRRVVYYRLSCEGHDAHWAATFLDPFAEFAGLRRYAAG